MEKDFFQDRSIESRFRNCVHPGQRVYICEKQAQKYACEMEHLTYGTVKDILTRHDHPRGIKVRIVDASGDEKVGRIVYILKNSL